MEKNENVKEGADELYKLAKKIGIEAALLFAFEENVDMAIEIPKELLNTPIISFDFPTRIKNVISKWCKIHEDKPRTVERIVSLVSMGDFAKEFVQGWGKKCQNYLKTFLLIQSYDRYTEEQKREFCYDVVLRNCEV